MPCPSVGVLSLTIMGADVCPALLRLASGRSTVVVRRRRGLNFGPSGHIKYGEILGC